MTGAPGDPRSRPAQDRRWPAERLVRAGRVGRPHGLDGSFRVEGAGHRFPVGTRVAVQGREARIERRAGTDERPLVRLSGVGDREAATKLRDEPLRVDSAEVDRAEGEWLADELIGLRVDGMGRVRRVITAPSCDLLEVGEEGTLVPFVSDAVKRVDRERGIIEVDRDFLDPADGRGR